MSEGSFFNEEENSLNSEGDDSSHRDDTTSAKRSGKHMSYNKKRIIFQFLLEKSKDLKLRRGSILLDSTNFSVPTRTISRIWSVGKKKSAVEQISQPVTPEMREETAMNEPKSTIHRRIRDGDLHPHTSSVKPLLTEENKKARLRFCLSMILRSDTLNVPMFSSGNNNYKQPHFIEDQCPRGGPLPLQLNCDEALVNSTIVMLSEG
ncbi:hypothetical protein POM88_025028 [Heracleum sosnowskyi]|uniref:Transposase n=1 Tax=Heracleum sosnowskyi TaxID=360622 RepID=A0AAD8I4J4_9APIA|nr:hypothetical protein POM88_025028 [Heracleum sosnowskyi]